MTTKRDRFDGLIMDAKNGCWGSSTLIPSLIDIILQAEEALKECDESMGYMSEYDIPLCMPDRVRNALKAIDAFRKGE